MKRKPTRMNFALKLLSKGQPLSCVQISKAIIKREQLAGSVALHLPGSIMYKLNNLVKKGILKYAAGSSEKGGRLYEINQ